MKKALYFFTGFALMASSANAQIAAVVAASSILAKPVVLADVNLKASFEKNTAALNWQGTTQLKVRRYELEKSADGENFNYITSFSGSEKYYTTADNNLFDRANYYRLKIINDEGSFLYSNVELIDTKNCANEIKVLPAQFDQKLFVWIPANTSINGAVISGADGKLQRKAVINNSTNIAAVELNGLAAGMYNISLQTSKGETIKLKFSKL